MQIDSNTMEIRASETYPVAISDEQILIECLELDNSHSELKTPSSNFLSSRKKYTGLSNVTLNI